MPPPGLKDVMAVSRWEGRRPRGPLAAAGVFALVVVAAVVPAVRVTQTSAATGPCSISYQVNQWTQGFTASVGLTNNSAPLTSWTLTWTFDGSQQITSAWNAQVTQTGQAVQATSLSYNAAVGTGGAVTATMTVAAGLTPPAPVQVSEYDVFAVRVPVLRLPLVGNAPLQPPEAVQEVASVELQVNVDASPLSIAIGDALMDALGSAPIGDLLTPPPQATNSAAPIAMTGVKYRITSPSFN